MAEAKTDTKSDPSQSNVKETIESILVAFILAFIFRAFVVEAFVIPTGSMGPTLMGAHLRLTCPDCGYSFATNASFPDDNIPSTVNYSANAYEYCPNCGHRIPLGGTQPVYFGDRILVLKYRYLFNQPDRWDVVVFKSPYERNRDPDDPKYPDNYIKRLIGRPGESVMILDGDIYIGSQGQKPTEFKIQRKPERAQKALWRTVYDNDFIPHGTNARPVSDWNQPWEIESGTGWKGPRPRDGWAAPQRQFVFDNPSGASSLRFVSTTPFDSLRDWLAYDESESRNLGGTTYVSDLKLECTYTRSAGSGPLRLRLTKRSDCFTAEFLPGKVVLHRDEWNNERQQPGASRWPAPLEASVPELDGARRPVAIEFSNVDYRVSVRVNGREVVAAEYDPNIGALLEEFRRGTAPPGPTARIIAENQTASIEHLRLHRDVYYLNQNGSAGDPFWASPGRVVDLGPDEYFVLGDNSAISLDARYWNFPVNLPREGNYNVQAGRVPGRFMLGKAFFVYWPAGYRPLGLQFGLEPDFGDMRFIH